MENDIKNTKYYKLCNIFNLNKVKVKLYEKHEYIKKDSTIIYFKKYIIDISKSKEIYNALKDTSDVEFKIAKDDNHFLSSHAFKDNYIYNWLEKRL